VLRFDAGESARGTTSVEYAVQVFADDLETGADEAIFSTHIRFVCLDGGGRKTPLP
jgi:acyl-CoA hydrolase